MATAKTDEGKIDGGMTAVSSALMMSKNPVAMAAGGGLMAGQVIEKTLDVSEYSSQAGLWVREKTRDSLGDTGSLVVGGIATVAATPSAIGYALAAKVSSWFRIALRNTAKGFPSPDFRGESTGRQRSWGRFQQSSQWHSSARPRFPKGTGNASVEDELKNENSFLELDPLDREGNKLLADATNSANGDWSQALAALRATMPDAVDRLTLAHSLAEWSGDNASIVKAFVVSNDVANLRAWR